MSTFSPYRFLTLLSFCLIFSTGCVSFKGKGRIHRPSYVPKVVTMQVTAYSDDKISTGWKRNWLGRPVYAYGPNKGKSKKVGITSEGTKARYGTIAADHRHYPPGTIMEIPGYGLGIVEDKGGAIKGNHIDLFFSTRQAALNWGNQRMKVSVWR